MAAVALPLLRSTVDPLKSSDSGISPAAPSAEPMTDVMSYQYPPPPHNGADMDMPPSGYLGSYSVPSQAPSGIDQSFPSRERSDSFSKSLKLKQPMSTPAVGPPPPAQTQTPQQPTAPGQDLAGERRRNKLGYHRTSVACGKYPGKARRNPGIWMAVLDADSAQVIVAGGKSGASRPRTTFRDAA